MDRSFGHHLHNVESVRRYGEISRYFFLKLAIFTKNLEKGRFLTDFSKIYPPQSANFWIWPPGRSYLIMHVGLFCVLTFNPQSVPFFRTKFSPKSAIFRRFGLVQNNNFLDVFRWNFQNFAFLTQFFKKNFIPPHREFREPHPWQFCLGTYEYDMTKCDGYNCNSYQMKWVI